MVAARKDFEAVVERAHQGFVRITVSGIVDADSLLSTYSSLLDEHAGTYRLWDYRNADLSKLTGYDLTNIVDVVAEKEGGDTKVRVALVVGREVDYGVSRMYEVLAEARYPAEVAVFRDASEAEAWLS